MNLEKKILKSAFKNLVTAKAMTEIYEENFKVVSKYVHATSRGHEVIQTAVGMQLQSQDYMFPYYRDDSMLLAIGMTPYQLMLQVLAKKDDPFSGGRTYYSHPSLNDIDKPKIPHQSSATGMQAIPATGVALGFAYKELDESKKRTKLTANDYESNLIFVGMQCMIDPPRKEAKPWLLEIAWRLDWLKHKLFGKRRSLAKQAAKSATSITYYNTSKIQAHLNFKFKPVDKSLEEVSNLFLKDHL